MTSYNKVLSLNSAGIVNNKMSDVVILNILQNFYNFCEQSMSKQMNDKSVTKDIYTYSEMIAFLKSHRQVLCQFYHQQIIILITDR